MTALERAKRFIRQNATTTALVIVPLAMASPATAAPIFNTAGASADFNVGLSPTAGAGAFSPLPNGGIRFVGDYDFEVSAVSGGSFTIELTLSGTGSGLLDVTTIPSHYDYLFTLGPELVDFSSSMTFFINGQTVGVGGPHGVSGSGGPNLTGWALTDTLSTWSVVLRADFFANASSTVHLNIPPHSIDIAPADTVIPEPASFLLIATGMGVLAFRRRQSRASQP